MSTSPESFHVTVLTLHGRKVEWMVEGSKAEALETLAVFLESILPFTMHWKHVRTEHGIDVYRVKTKAARGKRRYHTTFFDCQLSCTILPTKGDTHASRPATANE